MKKFHESFSLVFILRDFMNDECCFLKFEVEVSKTNIIIIKHYNDFSMFICRVCIDDKCFFLRLQARLLTKSIIMKHYKLHFVIANFLTFMKTIKTFNVCCLRFLKNVDSILTRDDINFFLFCIVEDRVLFLCQMILDEID